MNETVFRWINGWPDSFAPFFVFFSEATKTTVGKALFVAAAVVFAVSGNNGRKALFFFFLAVVLANTITNVFKEALPMLRPCAELDGVILRTGQLTSMGTASAHSANMASLATVIAMVWGWRGTFWVPIALFTGLSRIYVGVHYPSQVLLGWICGIFAGWLVVKAWDASVRVRAKAVEASSVEPTSASE